MVIFIIAKLTNLDISDATTGFRCYSNKALEDLYVLNKFTMLTETLFIAKRNNLKVEIILQNLTLLENLGYLTTTGNISIKPLKLYFQYFYIKKACFFIFI